jgi:leader peptidase (prepilin peptidase) / N-methyltransferase
LVVVLLSVAGLLGAVFGSFLNVVIHRLPRGESLMFPGSHCPTCGHQLRALDNIPLVSWVLLRGRCRSCAAPVPVRYPLVELLSAAVFMLAALVFGLTLEGVAATAFGALLIVIAFIDLDHLLVLDTTTLVGAAIALAAALATHRIVPALEGAATGALIFGAIYGLTRGAGMGLGDVKLAAMLGLFLGFPSMLSAIVAAFVIGAVLAIPVLIARRRGRRDALPFGPFLVMAAILGTFAPGAITGPYDAYRDLLNNYWLNR